MTDRFMDSPVPRYLQLAGLLRQRIARGVWSQGQKLPSLEALVKEFGVARVTVRQAIELLAREGLVSPQQGRGTFVTALADTDHWLKVVTTLDELARIYRDTQPKIVNIDESTGAPPLQPHEGKPADQYVFMRRVHLRENRPYCVIDIYLEERIFRKHPKRFRNETVIPLLTTMSGVRIKTARQVLTVSAADMDVAKLLEVPVNAPIALVRRIFQDEDNRVIYLAEVAYRGDAIHVEMDLKP